MSKRITESQIITTLKEAESGMMVKDVCRKYRIANATFYNVTGKIWWYETPDISCLRELLEEKNRRIKQIYANFLDEVRELTAD
ncbi:hypothetical protein FHQ26_07455 [Testudinibacter sp. TR-2022]|uniref:transposase n=1 Tax=Testudinibacter sp. TR-2022 TaxID=2585029 RepID=UPI00111AF686|nr:transposase [Testudinibacter sp. TR-2022]TNH02561.1 hypothetical protein FHQ22_09690 [Pasteurellaceae bacterium Phil31]TNH08369.1 hypothetical protein FHQ25_09590 [Testudinibacter sp. TR-2022]TNH09162.1 hypothetical protein FHQ26_07455 [Testudinibacter sp. TR-2022]